MRWVATPTSHSPRTVQQPSEAPHSGVRAPEQQQEPAPPRSLSPGPQWSRQRFGDERIKATVSLFLRIFDTGDDSSDSVAQG
jgi:hypothetical protein